MGKSELEAQVKTVSEQGFEGLVVKDALWTYEPGKRHWLLVKKDYLEESSMADSAQEEKANSSRKKAKHTNITIKSKEEVVMESPSTKRLKLEEERETEEERISKMMSKSTEMYSDKHWVQYNGQKTKPENQKAQPPPHWKCKKCLGNHWMSDCRYADSNMKRTTGIPRSFLKPTLSIVPGAKINPQGLIVINEMEKQAYSQNKDERSTWLPDVDQAKMPITGDEPYKTKETVNSNRDFVYLAKQVKEFLLRFPKRTSLKWKIDLLKSKFEKKNLDDCCKKIVDGAEVALKVEEKLVSMEAKVKTGEGDAELRVKVELVRRKMERYHFLMHLLSVSDDPTNFAFCLQNYTQAS